MLLRRFGIRYNSERLNKNSMNYELLRRKHLLLDTNVVINYMEHPKELEGVRKEFEDVEAIPILDELVRFEYIRGAASPSEIETLKNFLMILFSLPESDIDRPQFPILQETVGTAATIANIYSKRLKNLHAPAIDCMLAAQMKKYYKSLILVTSDHKDFPPLLFDRIGIETVDTGRDIINICFYVFNIENFEREQSEFAQAT